MLAGQLISEINGIVKVLSKDQNIQVIFNQDDAYTDGEIINLPEISLTENLSRKKVSAIRGLVDHECGHIRHTDIETMKVASKRINSKMLSFLLNVIEDCRIDTIVSKEMPGAAINIDQLNEDAIRSILKAIETIESEPWWFQPEWYRTEKEKFWGPLSVWALSVQERGNQSEFLDALISKIPKNIYEKSLTINDEVRKLNNSYDSLNLASHALHLFGIKSDKDSDGENEHIQEIIEILSSILTSTIANDVIEDSRSKSSAKDGLEDNKEEMTSIDSDYSNKYIALASPFDIIEHSKLKGDIPSPPNLKSELVRTFQDMIQTECRGFRTISDTGKKIDPKSLVKAYQGIPNVFLQKTSDRDIDTAMGILVDASGSMWGEKMHLAAEATFELASALQSFPIALEVAYFQTYFKEEINNKLIEKYPDIFTKDKKYTWVPGYRVIPNRLSIVKDYNQPLNERIHYFSGMKGAADHCNADGEALLDFSSRLEKRPEKKKIMIVLSDGLPACGVGYPSERDFLIQSINNIISRGIDIGAIGIISECVEEFYPIYSVVNEVNDLPLALADICKKMLRDSMRTIN